MNKHAGMSGNSVPDQEGAVSGCGAQVPSRGRDANAEQFASYVEPEMHADRIDAPTCDGRAQAASCAGDANMPCRRPAVVGRFAPTPSGRMHLGNAYAMLTAWLSARASSGRIVLRIEDIDAPRVVRDADRWIQDDLAWLGLDWDGEPVYQSDRLDRYEQVLQDLRARGLAYPCFCSRADIRAASAPNEGDGFVRYPGTCRRLWLDDPAEAERRMAEGHRYSWRLAMPPSSLADSDMCFNDRVFGPQRFSLPHDLGDTVIRRSDGLFAYQLAVTVDDLDMGVTDVVRGRDLLRSTALQLYIRALLQGDDGNQSAIAGDRSRRPALSFAHLPLVDNAQGRRMAKREHSLDLGFLRANGVGPNQVIGYCTWMLGLQSSPWPMSAADALEAFRRYDWRPLREHPSDRRVPDDPFALAATL